jgi:hypothetical protein
MQKLSLVNTIKDKPMLGYDNLTMIRLEHLIKFM